MVEIFEMNARSAFVAQMICLTCEEDFYCMFWEGHDSLPVSAAECPLCGNRSAFQSEQCISMN